MEKRHGAWLVLVAWLVFASDASASPIRWEFDATVREMTGSDALIGDLASLGVVPGASLHGFFVVEAAAPVFQMSSNQTGTTEFYLNAVLGAGFAVGSLTVSAAVPAFGDDVVVFHSMGTLTHRYRVQAASGRDGTQLELALQTFDSTLFPQGMLLSDPPALSSVNPYADALPDRLVRSQFSAGFGSNGEFGTFFAELTSLSRVPEPPAVLGLAPLFVAFALARLVRHSP